MGSLGFIPKPFPDEILYGILGRLQSFALYQSKGQLSLDLFGKKNVPAAIGLPYHINSLSKRINMVMILSEDEIINKHTLWPYFEKFLLESKRKKVFELMKEGNASTLYNSAGINASAMIKANRLKYCPACAKNDEAKYGITYWHRVHQIPEIHHCPHHNLKLITYHARAAEEGRSFFIDANEVIDTSLKSEQVSDPRIAEISKFMAAILYQESEFDINKVDYEGILAESEFNYASRINYKEFKSAFISFYTEDFIKKYLPSISESWIVGIIKRPHHYFHPLRHIMMHNFLAQVKGITQSLPFGEGPWECINRASDHFGQLVVTKMNSHIDTKTKRLIGRFHCECGMVYTKSSIELPDKKRKVFVRILEWGSVWHNALKKELASKNSFRTIARKLGTDAKTISKYSRITPIREPKPIKDSDKLKSTKRKKWTTLLTKYKTNKILNTRKKHPALYLWLYQNDNKWLLQTNAQHYTHSTQSDLRLDWQALDNNLVDLIFKTIEKLKAENYRGRITKSLISKIIKAQHFLLGKNSSNLKKSVKLINEVAETHEDHALRRINVAVNELKISGEPVRWKVMRKAGLRDNIKYSNKVIKVLNQY
jgi:hypothetical protein